MLSPVRNTQSPPQHKNPWQNEACITNCPDAFSTNANTRPHSRQHGSRSRGRNTPRQEDDRRPADNDNSINVPMYTANEVNRFLAEVSVPSLYQGKTPGQIVSNVASRMTSLDKLQPSGSNFANWELMRRRRALEIFGVPMCNMHQSILRQSNCHQMFQYLNSWFFTVTRAEQMTCWDRLINFKMSNYSNSAKAVSKLFEILDNSSSFWIELNHKTVGGMALQSFLEAGLEWRQETLLKKAVTPNQILKHTDIVKRQINLGSSKSSFLAMVPQAHQASTMDQSDLAKEYYDPSSWTKPNQVQGLDTYGLQCWNCRSTDHLLSKCKLPLHRDFDWPPPPTGQPCRQWQASPLVRANNQPVIASGNFQAWYPIMTPPGYTNRGYQPQAAVGRYATLRYGPM
ncbi:uncharacterized protein PGTG_15489 [Puccinia graminis f. sp. tritici CRL 75-36-700-3]|uniref:C2H2-type domain-containing protein n=1 Tax=Puccinia graminis f. sp. tritici (strain CRL 75-36-700-3 / race SCCL) TaxID=418459 RepID=E3KYB9_PUCGT|nr:uncharacterized protein PGTG_15489 [Puccinia graminis f. sp. tritici CRL 75-36-700-3]EFP89310.1 hypothetical protein PGTG_15489 [Puccinia graminis f. sp. tritici CRL 75-36-700-3]